MGVPTYKSFRSVAMNLALGVERTLLTSNLAVASEVGGFGADVERVVNFVAANSPAHATWIGFFGAQGDNDAEVRGFASSRYDGHGNKDHKKTEL